ncbi:starch synthase 3, chloroplastic/amyloplastic isoform X1 [Iris pallida]|uniref:Starch synthase 3, chloroplastic/amyloplastic isoform X1 n=1 Tax=Iris pallida TaxID=29817 RepID=A0AAX6EDI3_IRIPA|nr:starch synthase 3, chloroplastic/amyloplastic isoform X1 [Iris pallida]
MEPSSKSSQHSSPSPNLYCRVKLSKESGLHLVWQQTIREGDRGRVQSPRLKFLILKGSRQNRRQELAPKRKIKVVLKKRLVMIRENRSLI